MKRIMLRAQHRLTVARLRGSLAATVRSVRREGDTPTVGSMAIAVVEWGIDLVDLVWD